MRYYDYAFSTDVDQLPKKSKVDFREFGWYRSPLSCVNEHMFRNMRSSICFFAYRNDDNTVRAGFTFDESKITYQDTYEYIKGELYDVFRIKKVVEEPHEITMYRFLDLLEEGQRREYIQRTLSYVEAARLWIRSYYSNSGDNHPSLHYTFDERIISDGTGAVSGIYDQSLMNELNNIETHSNVAGCKGNLVHYIISARSAEASKDMIARLMQGLYAAGRIGGRRMEFISEMEPLVYSGNNHIEDLIENNYGGVIVFDLTEKFGCDPVDYVMTSKYLEKLLKKYRNHCLFVFTYNIDNPGFSYQLLPNLSKYVIPVMIREGSGDRKAAVKYMKSLIKGSEYSAYAGQAGEFMKLYPGNVFTQTDVLNAFERFESWCINRNILKAYDYDTSRGFMLDRDEGSAYERLNKLIGLDIVKKQIDRIITADMVEKERERRKGKDYQPSSMHMIFAGNPGTAKTTVAKLFAGIAKDRGILKSGAFVERGGMDLCGLGAVHAIREAFTAAKGGVLFIDEAYSMFGDTAVSVLIQEMENRRDDVIVILAGYNERMQDFMKINEGLKSRIPHWVDFPDYSVDELTEIFNMMLEERGFTATDDAVREARYIFENVRYTDNFGNGRYVRNLMERAAQNQAVRLMSDRENPEAIRKNTLFRIEKDDICMLDEGLKAGRPEGTAKKELDDMVGLKSVKEIIHKAAAYFKLQKLSMDKGLTKDKASMHMVFTGNPGTAKTTVARLFAEIMKDENVLPTGVFVEVGRADLVGDHVGSTAPLVKKKFKEAKGGVLFIDEAYSLCDGHKGGFGDEAINIIVQEMENHRDDVIVVFAGYPEPMKEFLDRNPGMQSRIAFHVEFADYDTDELCAITRLMTANKKMTITDAAMNKLRDIYESVRHENDYGNGRFVRKLLEEAEMNIAERLMGMSESELTNELITTIEERDIPEYTPSSSSSELYRRSNVGFAC